MHDKCSDGWRITGYYTPIETEFPESRKRNLTVAGKAYRFSDRFVAAVKMEGWGRTRFGWYLGYYSGRWHRSTIPRDSMNQGLVLGVAAIKSKHSKLSSVRIDSLLSSMGRSYFQLSDTGSGLAPKQVDIYTGEGEKGRQLSFEVTQDNATVCPIL